MCDVKKDDIDEYIVNQIIEMFKCIDIKDEDTYIDEMHVNIDEWVCGSTDEAKQIVDNYGVLKAIRLYKNEYGEFELHDDDDKVYLTLSYCIINYWFNSYYSYEQLRKDLDI